MAADETYAQMESLTHFAPGERKSSEEIEAQIRSIDRNPIIQEMLNSFNGNVFILNSSRQIVSANYSTVGKNNLSHETKVCGLRVGEVMGCKFSDELPGGCGTSQKCSQCGLMKPVLSAFEEKSPQTGECMFSKSEDGAEPAQEFSVLSTPIHIGDENFVIVCMQDISDKKRRQVLESVFFHDIMNTLGGLVGWSDIIQDMPEDEIRDTAGKIHKLTDQLVSEVRSQQAISQAEGGTLSCDFQKFPVRELFDNLRGTFEQHESSAGKKLNVSEIDEGSIVKSDRGLLERVLVNMLKNAFEASHDGGEVFLQYEKIATGHCFSVKNSGTMPPEVSAMIFKRSFSTKGKPGRGLGTYSMKIFGEQYLGGHVYFESDEIRGTVFSIDLPDEPAAEAQEPETEEKPGEAAGGDMPQAPDAAEAAEEFGNVGMADAPEDELAETGDTGEVPIDFENSAPISAARLMKKQKPTEKLFVGVKVLVVDDIAVMRNLIAIYLKNEGAEVCEASGGQETIMEMRKMWRHRRNFDAVYLDLNMPGMDGTETLERIRKEKELKKTPVVMLTAEGSRENIIKCAGLGISGYILKPAQKTQLFDSLKKIIRRKHV